MVLLSCPWAGRSPAIGFIHSLCNHYLVPRQCGADANGRSAYHLFEVNTLHRFREFIYLFSWEDASVLQEHVIYIFRISIRKVLCIVLMGILLPNKIIGEVNVFKSQTWEGWLSWNVLYHTSRGRLSINNMKITNLILSFFYIHDSIPWNHLKTVQ